MLMSLILICFGIFLGAAFTAIYNKLVALRHRIFNAFSQIDVQLKRRHDLIPNLVEVAKGYLSHEKNTLEAVISARNVAVESNKNLKVDYKNPNTLKSVFDSELALGGALNKLMAVVESYPELKADQTVAKLSEELSSTENRIAFARQAFNDEVLVYNTQRDTFPNVMISDWLGFDLASPWQIEDESEAKAPQISMS